MEQTLVILKPDAVSRGLTGELLGRFEQAGLRLVQLRKLRASKELLDEHYPRDDDWLSAVGQKTLDDYAEQGIDEVASLGTSDAISIGRMVKLWLVDFMSSGDIVVAIVEGNRAIESVRKLIGSTLPVKAQPGTIRGDFSTDSPDAANREQRPVRNLVHASGDPAEAAREIALWFGDE